MGEGGRGVGIGRHLLRAWLLIRMVVVVVVIVVVRFGEGLSLWRMLKGLWRLSLWP